MVKASRAESIQNYPSSILQIRKQMRLRGNFVGMGAAIGGWVKRRDDSRATLYHLKKIASDIRFKTRSREEREQ